MDKKGKKETIREKLIGALILYSGDELENDWQDIAMESKEELIERLISVLNYYYDEYNS